MARPRYHFLASASLAYALASRWGTPAALAAIAGGVFIDADHLVDFAWTRWRGARSHYLAPLHGWEIAGLLTALALFWPRAEPLPDRFEQSPLRRAPASRLPAPILAGIAAGVWLHLVHDLVSNRPRHPGVYSLLYRLKHGFTRESTGWANNPKFHKWSDDAWYRWL